MKLWLAKDSTGYMLTALPPKWRRVGRTDRSAWYARPGEPVAVRHLCNEGMAALLGRTLEDGEIVRIELTAKEITRG